MLEIGLEKHHFTKQAGTPLMVTQLFTHWFSTELKINAIDNEGNTALHRAGYVQNSKAFEALLAAGADSSIQNISGDRALDDSRKWWKRGELVDDSGEEDYSRKRAGVLADDSGEEDSTAEDSGKEDSRKLAGYGVLADDSDKMCFALGPSFSRLIAPAIQSSH
jgi:hypothetical protein